MMIPGCPWTGPVSRADPPIRRTLPESRPRAAAGWLQPSDPIPGGCWLFGQGEDEVELRSDWMAGGVQQHGAVGAGGFAGAAGDGERGVGAVVEEGALDGDVAAGKQGCPGAFPFGHAGRNGADAVTVVGGDLPRVGGVKDRVVEAKHVTPAVLGRMELLHRVGDRMLDYMNDHAMV